MNKVLAPTSGIDHVATARAIRALEAAINADRDETEALTTVVAGIVHSVTAGSSMVAISPTTGDVIVDVVPGNFTGIPMAGVVFSGTGDRVAKFSGTTLADSTITDDGALVTITSDVVLESTLEVQGTSDLQSDVDIGDDLDVIGDVTLHSTVEIDGTTTMHSHLTVDVGQALFKKAVGTGTTTGNANLILSETTAAAVGTGASLQFDTLYGGAGGEGAAIIKVNRLSDVLTGADLVFAVRESGTLAAIPVVMTLNNAGTLTVFGGSAPQLGVGVAVPTTAIDVRNTSADNNIGRIQNNSSTGYSALGFFDHAGTPQSHFGWGNTGGADTAVAGKNYWRLKTQPLVITYGTAAVSSPAVYIHGTNGNVNIGATQADPGFNLRVQGTFQGAGDCELGDSTSLDSHTIRGSTLAVRSSTTAGPIEIRNTSALGPVEILASDNGSTARTSWGYGNASFTDTARASRAYLWRNTGINFVFARTSTVDGTLFSSGNWRLGSTVTDPSVKLQVDGALTATGATILQSTLQVEGNATIGNAAGDAHVFNGTVDFNQAINVDGAAVFTSTLSVQGNASIGNAGTDAHTLLGTLNANATAGTNGQVLGIVAGVPQWATPSALSLVDGSGTLNTIPMWTPDGNTLGDSPLTWDGSTYIENDFSYKSVGATSISERIYVQMGPGTVAGGGPIYNINLLNNLALDTSGVFGPADVVGVNIAASATRNSGAETVTNTGVRSTASGGQVNIALETVAGDNYLNTSSGSTGVGFATGAALASKLTVSGTFSCTDSATLGNATSDTHTIKGRVTIQPNQGSAGSDVTVKIGSASVQNLGLGLAGYADASGGAYIMHNAYAEYSAGTPTTTKWNFTNAGYGSRIIRFHSGTGILFYADAVATTQDASFTPTLRMTLGNDGTLTLPGNLVVDGNCTLGNATSDAHTVNGNISVSANNGGGAAAVLATNTASGATSARCGLRGRATGSYDTSAGVVTVDGIQAVIDSTRSAGANNLVNRALLCDASGGQTNIALLTDRGDVILNVTSGTTNIRGAADLDSTLNVDGNVTLNANVTLGNASTDTITATAHIPSTLTFASSTGPTLRAGSGSPEGAVTAVVGSIYMRSDGGAATSVYIKESGSGNTGWVAK